MKAGFRFSLVAGAGSGAGPSDCNGGATITAFYATAVPLSMVSGARSFAMNVDGAIWQLTGGTRANRAVRPARPPGAINNRRPDSRRRRSRCYTGIMSLAPALLLSMPQLLDPNFARTVVLLCEHAAEGAFGLVVNRPSEITAAEAVSLTPPIASPNQSAAADWRTGRAASRMDSDRAPAGDVEYRELGAGLYLSASPLLLRQSFDGDAAAETHAWCSPATPAGDPANWTRNSSSRRGSSCRSNSI